MAMTKSLTEQPTQNQMSKIISLTNDAFDQGVFGLSYGLMYPPGIFSTTENLKTLAQVTADKAVRLVEKAVKKGLEVMWDIYPHFCGNSYLSVFLPAWFIENLDENIEDPAALKKVKFELRMASFLIGFDISKIQIMEARYPASFGAFPRILGHFVRDKQTMSLKDAIAKMTGKTAQWMGISNRGKIKPGNFADIVLFNADTIADNTTIIDTTQKPTGIEKVFVNGEITVIDGCYIKNKKVGQVLLKT